jgi:hypothetical protein
VAAAFEAQTNFTNVGPLILRAHAEPDFSALQFLEKMAMITP